MKSIEPSLYRIFLVVAAMILMAASAQRAAADGANSFTQTNLVSDIPGMAATTDPNLVNPWGMSSGATSPIWVSDNGAGVATLYTGAGGIVPLVVTILPAGSAAPTGQVFNPNPGDFGGSHFIFATEGGTIAAWSGGTNAALTVDSSGTGAVYKGLALGRSGGLRISMRQTSTTGRSACLTPISPKLTFRDHSPIRVSQQATRRLTFKI